MEWASNALIEDRFFDSKKDYTKFERWIIQVINIVEWKASQIGNIPHNP